MVGLPKAFTKIAKKLDVRVKPDPELAKNFKPGCGRRYMNIGLQTISFFSGVADKIKDKDLLFYAEQIEDAVYNKKLEEYETFTKLYKYKLAELGLWKSTVGMSKYQKMKVLAKFRGIAKKHMKEEEKKKKGEE